MVEFPRVGGGEDFFVGGAGAAEEDVVCCEDVGRGAGGVFDCVAVDVVFCGEDGEFACCYAGAVC